MSLTMPQIHRFAAATICFALAGMVMAAGSKVADDFPPLPPAQPWRHPLEAAAPAQAADIAQVFSAGSNLLTAVTASTSDAMSLRLRLKPKPSEISAHFLIAVPCGSVTTAVITSFRQWPADGGPPVELTPPADFAVSPLGYVRNVHIARALIPFGEAQPDAGAIEAEIALKFDPCDSAALPESSFLAAESRGPVREMLRYLVVNPDDIERYAVADPSVIPGADDRPAWNPAALTTSAVRLRVPVERTGIYRITGADLESSGVILGQTDPAHLRLLLEGVCVPILWQRAAEAPPQSLTRDDVLLFYGLENPSRFTRVKYLLAGCRSVSASLPDGHRGIRQHGAARTSHRVCGNGARRDRQQSCHARRSVSLNPWLPVGLARIRAQQTF
ncbi:MAG: hypothetical protein N2111_06235 [Candidatus Sumerlaeaceae bacterium]|nr:hypothetical protein [Candidatus Sumerlaeaceae bacterium]